MVSPEKYPTHIKQNMGTAHSTHDDRKETNAELLQENVREREEIDSDERIILEWL